MIIKAVFSDFDGVFTDNHVLIDEMGNELVKCFRSDGIGIEKLKKENMLLKRKEMEKSLIVMN